MVGGDPFYLKF